MFDHRVAAIVNFEAAIGGELGAHIGIVRGHFGQGG
jgi:hypothetical protein